MCSNNNNDKTVSLWRDALIVQTKLKKFEQGSTYFVHNSKDKKNKTVLGKNLGQFSNIEIKKASPKPN